MESASANPSFTALPQLAGHIDGLDELGFQAITRRVVDITNAVMTAASSTTDGTAAEVLLALARAYGMLWMQLGGGPDQAVRAFAESMVLTGALAMSETFGHRVKGSELTALLKEAAVQAKAQKEG